MIEQQHNHHIGAWFDAQHDMHVDEYYVDKLIREHMATGMTEDEAWAVIQLKCIAIQPK